MTRSDDVPPAAVRAMAARARALARPLAAADQQAESVLVRLTAGREPWAIDARDVAHIGRADGFTRIPGVPGVWIGRWRGRLVNAVDIPALLGLPPFAGDDTQARHVIVLVGGRTAVFSDQTPTVQTIAASALRPGRGALGPTELPDGTPVLDALALHAAARSPREENR